MKKIVPDPPAFTLQDAAQCSSTLLDRAATERALNYYLHNHAPAHPVGNAPYAIHESVNFEAALAQASDLLRCMGASASEAGNGLSGTQRELVLSIAYLAELVKAYVDKPLDSLAAH